MLVPLLALSFQLIPPIILFKISDLAYMEPRHFSELWEQPISLMALVFFAVVSLSLGSIGVYGLLTRARPIVAVLLISLCCLPALLGGAVYLHVLFVFLAVI